MVQYLFTERVRDAHSPYISKKDLAVVEQGAKTLGGAANGCSEAVYGELQVDAISKLLQDLEPPLGRNDVLYDLGSGRALVPVLASIEFGVKKSVGIELSHTRTQMGCEALQVLKGYLPRSIHGTPSKSIDLFEGSMLDADMDDATVVFMCATVSSK